MIIVTKLLDCGLVDEKEKQMKLSEIKPGDKIASKTEYLPVVWWKALAIVGKR